MSSATIEKVEIHIGEIDMDPQQPLNNTTQSNPQTPPTPAEPPKNKKSLIITIVTVAVLVIIGVIVFAILSSNKNNTSTYDAPSSSPSNNGSSSEAPSKYQKYSVTDKVSGATFSVLFYKDAKVEEKSGRTYLNSGEAGSMFSVYLGVATGDKIDCGNSPTTTMKLTGESTTVCYAADNTQYAGYAKTKTGAIKINLAGQTPISIDDAKAIMESVTF